MDTRKKGQIGENIAEFFLREQGALILDRNFYFKGGEVDLIIKDFSGKTPYICFVEVKARKNTEKGRPEEAVTYSKQKKIIKGAMAYMNFKKLPDNTAIRFDVVAILNNQITWIKNAFQAF